MKKNHKYNLQQNKSKMKKNTQIQFPTIQEQDEEKAQFFSPNITRTKWRNEKTITKLHNIMSKHIWPASTKTHTPSCIFLNHLLQGHHHPAFWGLFWVFKMEMYVSIVLSHVRMRKINENISKRDFTTISLKLTIDVDILCCPMSRCGAKAVVSAWAQALWCLPSDELSLEHLSF